MLTEKYDVCVVGAGIIGMTTAYCLSQKNLKVCVIDKNPNIAKGSSEVNGGIMDPERVDHLVSHGKPSRDNIWNIFKITFLYPKWTLNHLLYRYRLFNNDTLSSSMTSDIRELGRDTISNIKKLSWPGLKIGLNAILPDMIDPTKNLTEYKLREHNVGTGSSYLLSQLLRDECKKKNVDFFLNHEFLSFNHSNGNVKHINTNKKKIVADKYILTMGIGLSRWFPIIPFYGLIREYSYPYPGLFKTSKIIIGSIPSRHSYMTLINNKLRLGGGVYISSIKPNINDFHLPIWKNNKPLREWVGYRPVCSDGTPIIGKLPGFKNVYVNGGHGFWGWTLSFGSSKLLVEHLTNNKPIPKTFDSNRFIL